MNGIVKRRKRRKRTNVSDLSKSLAAGFARMQKTSSQVHFASIAFGFGRLCEAVKNYKGE